MAGDLVVNILVGLLSIPGTLQLTENPIKPVSITPSPQRQKSIYFSPLELEELISDRCQNVPDGEGVPAFQPGIHRDDVLRILGTPARTTSGYWSNTRAISYNLIPDRVSLGFLFDQKSQRIRQTEASFTTQVNPRLVEVTLNGMIGCKLNDRIQQGLQQVWLGQSRRYFFTVDSLKGVIENEVIGTPPPPAIASQRHRLYIGIWEADLH